MLEKANLGNIFESAIEHRSTDGIEKELQDHFGLASHQIPLEMLRDTERIERRAAATITGDVPISQSSYHRLRLRTGCQCLPGGRYADRSSG